MESDESSFAAVVVAEGEGTSQVSEGPSLGASLTGSDVARESLVSSQFDSKLALLSSGSEVPLVLVVKFSLFAVDESIESLLSSGTGAP